VTHFTRRSNLLDNKSVVHQIAIRLALQSQYARQAMRTTSKISIISLKFSTKMHNRTGRLRSASSSSLIVCRTRLSTVVVGRCSKSVEGTYQVTTRHVKSAPSSRVSWQSSDNSPFQPFASRPSLVPESS